ncbi:MAG: MMPL family transporter, partial [Bdellovibrionales bacterium]|nr:MMPL family transporter [Bdellovibrionales bacterium]
ERVSVRRNSRIENTQSVIFSLKYPIFALLISVLVLTGLSFFVKDIVLGSTVERDILPKSMQSAQAYEALRQRFPDYVGTNFWVVMSAPELTELEEQGSIQPFFDDVLKFEQVSGPFSTEFSDDGTVARYEFIAKGNGNAPNNQYLIKHIRETVIPSTLTNLGIDAHLSGNLPFVSDEALRYSKRTPLVLFSILAASFAFLLIAFRSIAIPLKAIALNLLSTGAAFGMLVIIFQSGAIEAWNYGVVESFVPALLFSILFGLSMDYHVFLLSRIQEEVIDGASTKQAVIRGIKSTWRTITSAALIMAAVFTIIATLELPVMKQLGLGLAIAILIDATVIRSVLLPASMILLGKWNWYLPRWLGWLPRMKI